MVLDSGREIYVWVGLHSTDQEREAGFSMAQVFELNFNLQSWHSLHILTQNIGIPAH